MERIATRDYEPSDDDVLRARIRTLGVQEYSLIWENSSESPVRVHHLNPLCVWPPM